MKAEAHKQRFFMIDIVRILCALIIFVRHAQTMAGFYFGNIIGPLCISMTNIVMTCFFILSGFSLYLSHGGGEQFTKKYILRFYAKRFISILPLYYLVHILWVLFFEENIIEALIYTPIEILGIQSVFSSVFGVMHNGGTWFVSCILLCYIVYPLFTNIIQDTSRIKIKTLFLILIMLYYYLPYYGVLTGSISLYTNPFERMLEFFIGILLAYLRKSDNRNERDVYNVKKACLIVIVSAVFLVLSYYISITWMMNLSIIFICVGLYYSTKVRYEPLDNNKILHYISTLTYPFYLFQMLLWTPSLKIISWLGMENSKWSFLIALTLLILMCIISNELYVKPIKKIMI